MESLMKINDPILLALIATGFTWFMTALDDCAWCGDGIFL